MLFAFDNIWKSILILAVSWAIYGVIGYEFAVITLLSVLLINSVNSQ